MNAIEKALFDEYIKHWDLIADSAVKVMEELIQATEAIARVRELARKLEQEQPYIEMAVYAFVSNLIIQALDGEQ